MIGLFSIQRIRSAWGLLALAAALVLACAACSGGGPGDKSSASAASSSASPGSASGSAGSTGQGTGQITPANLEQAYESVISRVLPSVVEIRTSKGLGSGVVFDNKGDIVTNAHVVGSSKSFTVYVAGSAKPMRARLLSTYPPDDLAVISVGQSAHLVPAKFADSSKLKVGQIVLAMGNPLGLASSVTDGIISATGRTVPEPQGGGSPGATLPDVIQTSAPINPGNSGGALVDLSGQVVGIPTLAAEDPQMGGAAVGIGFAIPANIVTNIAGQIIKSGHVTNSHRAELGIRAESVQGPNGQPGGVGVVSVVAGGPAAKAGMRSGEIITAIDGQATPDTETLAVVLANLHPGQRVPVKVLKPDGTKAVLHVSLGQLPGS